MTSSGEAWKPFYKKSSLSWLEPEKVNHDYLKRWARSEWIKQLLRAIDNKSAAELRILEAGCGTGLYAMTFSMMGFSADAFDYNEEAIEIAKHIQNNLQAEKSICNVHLFKGNLLNIEIPSNSYDFVFNQAVLEYFCKSEERAQALREMVRVTKPGGKVAAIVQYTQHPFSGVWRKKGWPGYIDQPPVIAWTPQRLRQEFESAGLIDIKISGIQPWKAFFFWPPTHQKNRLLHEAVYLLGRCLEKIPLPDFLRAKFGIQLIGFGTKP